MRIVTILAQRVARARLKGFRERVYFAYSSQRTVVLLLLRCPHQTLWFLLPNRFVFAQGTGASASLVVVRTLSEIYLHTASSRLSTRQQKDGVVFGCFFGSAMHERYG